MKTNFRAIRTKYTKTPDDTRGQREFVKLSDALARVGMTDRIGAEGLGISAVHFSNVRRGASHASRELIASAVALAKVYRGLGSTLGLGSTASIKKLVAAMSRGGIKVDIVHKAPLA